MNKASWVGRVRWLAQSGGSTTMDRAGDRRRRDRTPELGAYSTSTKRRSIRDPILH